MFVDYVSVHTEARAVHFSHSAGIHQAPAVDQVLFWGYKAINDMIPALFSLWESEKKKKPYPLIKQHPACPGMEEMAGLCLLDTTFPLWALHSKEPLFLPLKSSGPDVFPDPLPLVSLKHN